MKSLLGQLALSVALVIGAAGCAADEDTVDPMNGKIITEVVVDDTLTLEKGASKQVTAVVRYADGSRLDVSAVKGIVWTVDDAKIATVSNTGTVTGVRAGATKVAATYQGVDGTNLTLRVR